MGFERGLLSRPHPIAVPALTLALVNSNLPRRPAGAVQPERDDPLADRGTASTFLAQWHLDGTITRATLPQLRAWRKALAEALGRTAAGKLLPAQSVASLNALATRCPRTRQLTRTLEVRDVTADRDAAQRLIARCLDEIASCDIRRIKRCARPACGLFFYDVTRNHSTHWHAENPCGWRSRDERRRSGTSRD